MSRETPLPCEGNCNGATCVRVRTEQSTLIEDDEQLGASELFHVKQPLNSAKNRLSPAGPVSRGTSTSTNAPESVYPEKLETVREPVRVDFR